MKSSKALPILAEMSASQWGMVTTAQAAKRGIKRLDLSRLAQAGHFERIAHGVYRDAGVPTDEFEGLRAAWLATDPSRSAEDRLHDLSSGIVVAGQSAASLHNIGDLPADRHEFSSPTRRQTQRSGISYRQRLLESGDVTIAHGLPVTTIERTIADLVEARTDLSLVADVLRDAARVRIVDNDRLSDLLSPLAARNGHPKDDGAALLDQLNKLAGLDIFSRAAAITTSKSLSDLVTAKNLASLDTREFSDALIGAATQRAFEAVNQAIAESLEESMAPMLNACPASIAESLAKNWEQATQNVLTRGFLADFGEKWVEELTATMLTGGFDKQRTRKTSTVPEVAELVEIGDQR